jgi:hypothetical protein
VLGTGQRLAWITPDFGQLHNAATAGTLKRIITKALCDPLAPLEMLEGSGQGLQVEERELEAKCVHGRVDERDEFAFYWSTARWVRKAAISGAPISRG